MDPITIIVGAGIVIAAVKENKRNKRNKEIYGECPKCGSVLTPSGDYNHCESCGYWDG